VNRRVSPPLAAKSLHVWPGIRGRLVRQLHGEIAEREQTRLKAGLAIVVRRVLRQLLCCALGTEVVCVRLNSVVAVVRAGDHYREKLTLRAAELRGAEHDRLVEAHRSA
jgi:hypothetical protein